MSVTSEMPTSDGSPGLPGHCEHTVFLRLSPAAQRSFGEARLRVQLIRPLEQAERCNLGRGCMAFDYCGHRSCMGDQFLVDPDENQSLKNDQ